MMRKQRVVPLLLIGAGLLLAGCAPVSQFVMRDAALAGKAKKIAVLPFQNANARASEDTAYQTSKTAFTQKFLNEAQGALAGKYEFVPQEQIMAELKKMGFEGFDPNKGVLRQMSVQPTGYTVLEAIQVGKNVGADAVLLGMVSMPQAKPFFTISARMLDVKTGKVILAASSQATSGGFSPWNGPIRRVVQHLKEGQ